MRALLALVLLSAIASAETPRFRRFTSRSSMGRTQRGLQAVTSLAFFEAFPVGGAGTSGACSTTPPTGAKGEVLTFTRASTAMCTKTASGGLATTGISDSDLVLLSTNQPRVEYDANGVLGLLVESASTPGNVVVQSELPCNAAYVDVGAPTCSAGAAAGPLGAASMAQFTDASAVAFAGRAQVIADTSQTQHTVYAYVKAGTASSATITLSGTGNSAGDCTGTVTGLSTTTSKILSCTGAAYGVGITAITVTVTVGTVVADMGTLFVYGYDAKPSAPYVTSHIPTTTVAVARAVEGAIFALASAPGSIGSAAGSHTAEQTGSVPNTGGPGIYFGSSARALQGFSNSLQAFDGTNNPVVLMSYVAGTTKRAYSSWSTANGWLIRNVTDSLQTTSAFAVGTWAPTATLNIQGGSAAFFTDGIVSRLCYDPLESRCR